MFEHACKLGLEGIVSKRRDLPYNSGRSPNWIKSKNPNAPAVKREAEEDWGDGRPPTRNIRAPVTLGHIRSHDCRDLLVYCNSGRCHHRATMNADSSTRSICPCAHSAVEWYAPAADTSVPTCAQIGGRTSTSGTSSSRIKAARLLKHAGSANAEYRVLSRRLPSAVVALPHPRHFDWLHRRNEASEYCTFAVPTCQLSHDWQTRSIHGVGHGPSFEKRGCMSMQRWTVRRVSGYGCRSCATLSGFLG